jgi:signal transduction histidine kinase
VQLESRSSTTEIHVAAAMAAVAGPDFLAGGGEMGALMRAKDWSQTPLGPVETWSPTLRMMTGFLLANRFPLLLWWGPQYLSIYNDAYRPILGNKHPDYLGRPVAECWSEIWHVLKPLIDKPFNGGPATWMDDIQLEINRYGFVEETHFTVAYSPVPDESAPRGIGGVLATVHEITEKVIGERRLQALGDLGRRATEARTAETACAIAAETLADHARDMPFALIYLLDEDGRHARLAGTTGLGMDEAASPRVIDLSHGAADSTGWPLAEAVHGEAPITVEDLRERFGQVPAGPWTVPPHRAVLVPIRSNKAHQLAGVLVAGVSPMLELNALYLGFFDLVGAQIATAIANARAYEEERKRTQALAEIDRAKTVFFSNISHEFRTPLTLLLGPLEDMLHDAAHDALSPTQRERVDLAYRNSLRLLRLVNALLDFSRIEAGHAQARYQRTDLSALTADLASGFRSATEKAGLFLEIDCPPLPEQVMVDRDMWEAVVLNLLSNAFKFSFEGGITVSVRAQESHAVLSVRDTGVGIPAHELPRLFERFHRIEGQRSRSFEGSGIGLALVHELLRLHGGTIVAQDAPVQGAEFIVSIPFGTAHLPRACVSDAPAPEMKTTRVEAFVQEALRWLPDQHGDRDAAASLPTDTQASPRPTVLLADDNADMRGYVSKLLADHYDVQTVADGQAALEAIRAHRPDLLLADVMMPRLDGFELLRSIRDDPALRDLPFIMLSARAGGDASAEGLDAGADDYLIKPFAARELLARVRANLDLSRMRRSATEALQEWNKQLEARVAREVAAREEAQAGLAQAQRMDALGQLAGGIAHDFNNVIQAVQGAAGIIEHSPHSAARVLSLAHRIIEASERGAAVTRRLLAFSRRSDLRAEPVDAVALLDGMQEILSHTLGTGVRVQANTERELPLLLADKGQLETVLVNLATNARDAMQGMGTLIFGATVDVLHDGDSPSALRPATLAAGVYVCLSATDTGPGMSPEVLARAQEPFFTTKPPGTGTGLGLAMARGFVEQSGGAMLIESAPGRGTVVKLWLPVAQASSPDHAAGENERAVTAPVTTRARLLLVDDDEIVRETLAEMLDAAGYTVLPAASGVEALALLDAGEQVAVVISDLSMPNMDGVSVIREVQRRRPHLPAILLTGFANSAAGIHLDAPTSGTLTVLRKPVPGKVLAEHVAMLLEGTAAAGERP